jgi:hypothetical protein
MTEAVCVCTSTFGQAIAQGKRYPILAIDVAKRQVRIRDGNGRARWYPMGCFELNGRDVPVLEAFQILDPIKPDEAQVVEVDVLLSDGQRRWRWFATPKALANNGDWIEGTKIPFHFANRHVIVAGELSEELIGLMLRHLDSQGALADCTIEFTDSSGGG